MKIEEGVFLALPPESTGCKHLCDEVDGAGGGIDPRGVELDERFVLEGAK